MKRKIAAIFAADIAGYSRLVAEDEEETLRRLASYRQVTDDFIARSGGRIFNTAGDAVLAEFPSAVEAVRCAIDIQESLRTRNMAYPPSRQMSFRIGITIGDVVERDGDLLGDGVNIAARLEGLAEVGGICISRAVHEQVANKLSVQFADIGAQEVKNIPTPVHAYMVAMRREDGSYATPQVKKPAKAQGAAQHNWMWPVAVTVVSLAAIGVGGFLYFTKLETSAPSKAAAASNASPAPSTLAPAATAAVPPPPMVASTEKFVAASIPFVGDKARAVLASEYAPAGGFKAFALSVAGVNSFVTAQPSEEAAKSAAVEQCQKRADAAQSPRKCELYAVGDTVVYTSGRPPLPPLPWIRHDAATGQPFTANYVPLIREAGKARLESVYVPARKNKALAIGPGGALFFPIASDSVEEAVRRALESCRRDRRRSLHDRRAQRQFRGSDSGLAQDNRLLQGCRQYDDLSRCARRRRAPARGCLERLERSRGRRGWSSRAGIESGDGTGCGQRGARRMRQARQQLSGYCDWPVCSRT